MLEQLGEYGSFGDDIDDPDSVLVRAYGGISDRFYLWVLKYGEGIKVIEPADIRKNFMEILQEISKMHSA